MTTEGLTPDETDELAHRARDGDRDALEALLSAVRPRTLNICRGVLPHSSDAEDACQEALLNVATQVGAPLGTVKAQIHHGRKLVRPLLRGST